ncbi:MarR family winged helix-turn-helix transcriptional regulator [Georgenia sp. SYP-B2076]|uniref:MarR family winged helix-turn-helix transcriptional regulator n=1 Tax=Georgenia sp. SYP-B2076 TaxID=2495881 RepID=UPI000F8E97D6|nr:MarR family transcriptional regulator [Georgenia sp. SYP-B2076]
MTIAAESPAPAQHRPERRPDLATNLRIATLRLSRRLRNESSSEVSEAQYSVLAAVVHNGPLTPKQLADRERVQPPSMTRTVAALEDAGYVARTPHPEDGRQVVVTATDAGRDLVKEIKRRRNAWLNKGLARLTPAEREVVAEAAVILRRMVEE